MKYLRCVLGFALTVSIGRAQASDAVTIFSAGRAVSVVGESGAKAEGLTVVDLGASFTPAILRDEPSLGVTGVQPYAPIYRALADERFDDVPAGSRAEDEHYLELYGIFPTFRVHRARLLDEERHACHRAIDSTPLKDYPGKLWQLPPLPEGVKPAMKTLAKRASHAAAVNVIQAHLRCDRLLDKRAKEGQFDMWTAEAVRMFQRRHMVISWGIVDEPTRTALLSDSRELDYHGLLRALRERVVAATGLIEDGSAGLSAGTVFGRSLDPTELSAMHAYGVIPNASADLISPATEAAARGLGWTSPEEAARWFREHDDRAIERLRVALPLPAPPAYHRTHMDLRVEIDRGDVWYAFPYDETTGKLKPQPVHIRPTVTLYVRDGSKEVALVRWNTTIGGFQPETLPDGSVGLMYKNSDVGPRVWRHVVATPAWLPPDGTPDADLVRRINGKVRLNREALGPGFGSAYGLSMMVNEIEWKPPRGGAPTYVDRGVRMHGSVSYRSILKGNSHGCHRLFNHLAIRLSGFLVNHRDHLTEGKLPVAFMRKVDVEGTSGTLSVTSRGFGYELTPPVPVNVLEGKIKGARKQPLQTAQPLPLGYEL